MEGTCRGMDAIFDIYFDATSFLLLLYHKIRFYYLLLVEKNKRSEALLQQLLARSSHGRAHRASTISSSLPTPCSARYRLLALPGPVVVASEWRNPTAAAAVAVGAPRHRPPPPPRRRAPAPRDAGPVAPPRPAHAAPALRAARRRRLLRGRRAGDAEDPRPRLRRPPHDAHGEGPPRGQPRRHRRALRRRVAAAPQDLHPRAPHRPPRPLLRPHARGGGRPAAPLSGSGAGLGSGSGEPERADRCVRGGLGGSRRHRQPVREPWPVPAAAGAEDEARAGQVPAGPLPVVTAGDARQLDAAPDEAGAPRDDGVRRRHRPRAPGEQGGRRRRRGSARCPPQNPERGRARSSPHRRRHQDRYHRHVHGGQRDVGDGAAVGDGGAREEPRSDAQGAGGGPARGGRARHGGHPGEPPLPGPGHQGDAPAAPSGDADPARVPDRVPGAGVRRAGGGDGAGQRVGHRPGRGELGRRRRAVPAGAVRRQRRRLQGHGLRVHPVRRRAADVPRGSVRAGQRGARARQPPVPLRLGVAGARGGAGHGRGHGTHHAAALRSPPCSQAPRAFLSC